MNKFKVVTVYKAEKKIIFGLLSFIVYVLNVGWINFLAQCRLFEFRNKQFDPYT